jgi:hypothetical protein
MAVVNKLSRSVQRIVKAHLVPVRYFSVEMVGSLGVADEATSGFKRAYFDML